MNFNFSQPYFKIIKLQQNIRSKLWNVCKNSNSILSPLELLHHSQAIHPSLYCMGYFSLSFYLYRIVTTGGLLFDLWVLNFTPLKKLERLLPNQRKSLVHKQAYLFYWDFAVWCYRFSQKRSKILFKLTLLLKYYGLSNQGELLFSITTKSIKEFIYCIPLEFVPVYLPSCLPIPLKTNNIWIELII